MSLQIRGDEKPGPFHDIVAARGVVPRKFGKDIRQQMGAECRYEPRPASHAFVLIDTDEIDGVAIVIRVDLAELDRRFGRTS